MLVVYCADSLKRAIEAKDSSLLHLECKLIDFQKTKFLSSDEEGALDIDYDCLKGVSNLITEILSI